MKIDFKLFDLSRDKIKEDIAYYVELLPDRFIYHIEGIVDREPDISEEVYESEEDKYIYEHSIFKKELLTGCSMYSADEGLFFVDFEITGSGSVIKINFQTKKEATLFLNKVTDYIFKNKTKDAS